MDAKIKKSPLVTREANIVDDNQPEEAHDGDVELSNMMASIETMDDDFLCTGHVEINSVNHANNQELMCQFVDDSDFNAAPGLCLDD